MKWEWLVVVSVALAGCGGGTCLDPFDYSGAGLDVAEDIGALSCIPVCADGQQCGSDGCGGTCGDFGGGCSGELVCDGTACIEDPCPDGFVLIPTWTYMMGSPLNEPGRLAGGGDETLHKVTISKPFCMSATEVTNLEWFNVTGTNPSFFAADGDDLPVQNINWYDAVAFCNLKSVADGQTPCYEVAGETGTFAGGCVAGQIQCAGDFLYESVTRIAQCTGYHLPTEAEWELAGRAGTSTSATQYDEAAAMTGLECQSPNPTLDPFAWFCGNSSADYDSAYDCADFSPHEMCGPQPVASKTANAWGLYDMLGNVFEFCQDQYWWFPEDDVVDPVGEYSNGYNRIIRGGSWSATASFARVASRVAMNPVDRGDVGIRLVIGVDTTQGGAR